MAATTTRMLLLGAVALFGPVNGYQIRRELMSWRVDEWANIKPGSIYHGLSALAEHGLLVRHDLVDGGRAVAVIADIVSGELEIDPVGWTPPADDPSHQMTADRERYLRLLGR